MKRRFSPKTSVFILVLPMLWMAGCVNSRTSLRRDLRRCKVELVTPCRHVSDLVTTLGMNCSVKRLRFSRPVYVSTRIVHPGTPKGFRSGDLIPLSELELVVLWPNEQAGFTPRYAALSLNSPEPKHSSFIRWPWEKEPHVQNDVSSFFGPSTRHVELGRESPLFTGKTRPLPVDGETQQSVESAHTVYISFSTTPPSFSPRVDGPPDLQGPAAGRPDVEAIMAASSGTGDSSKSISVP